MFFRNGGWKIMKPINLSVYISNYLSKYLPGIAGLSTNTILSYRDMFRLLLNFYESELSIFPEKIQIDSFNQDNILNFLKWLENKLITAFLPVISD